MPRSAPRRRRRNIRSRARLPCVYRTGAAPAAPNLGGIGADRSRRIEVRLYDALLISAPGSCREFGHLAHQAEAVRYFLRISAPVQRLHLDDGRFGAEVNRHVGLDEAQVGEQRTEPAVAFDDAFVD